MHPALLRRVLSLARGRGDVVKWLLLLGCLTLIAATYPKFHLNYVAAIDPPHNEYISGRFEKAKAERFYFELTPSMEWDRLNYHVSLIGHGVQDWHPKDYWGSRSDYWTNSDAWKVNEMRYDISHGGTYDLIGKKLQIYSDFVMPIDRPSYYGVYYWRVGVSGRFF